MLIERTAALFDEQKNFVDDLHAAVRRLSDSNEKKDKTIERQSRELSAEREKTFNLTLELRTKQREVEELDKELEAARKRLRAREPSPGPPATTGDD